MHPNPSEGDEATAPGHERPASILVVDDDPQTAGLLRRWFDASRYTIHEAADGAEGVEAAVELQPDLILMDLKMPGLDGISAARTLKSRRETEAIPVVLLTACRDTEAKVEAFGAGADDYVVKPFEFGEIDARVRVLLDRSRHLRSLESRIRNLADSNRNLEQLLMVDEKTGLYNFREFQRRLRAEWERSTRYAVPLSVVFLDLDRFKQLNDTLGHQAGDRVLQEFATLVTGGARANDIAARYGGEEFAVILPHTDAEMALRVAQRIRRAVAEFQFLEDESPTRVTVSAGVATYPSDPRIDSVDALIRAADEALYKAKDAGRNRVIQSRRRGGRFRDLHRSRRADESHP